MTDIEDTREVRLQPCEPGRLSPAELRSLHAAIVEKIEGAKAEVEEAKRAEAEERRAAAREELLDGSATTSSVIVFHAPQDGQRPIQRGLVSPHWLQT